MNIINFGSLNIDHVYSVEDFVHPGETKAACSYQIFSGGKGLNQSIAAAKAGAKVYHAGMLGDGGDFLQALLADSGVDTSLLKSCDIPQGHAVIQVSESGENCILLYRGSNFAVTEEYVDEVLSSLPAPAYLMLQNEISCLPYIIDRAAELGFYTVLNASPIDSELMSIDLGKIHWLMINEIEGEQLSGKSQPEDILSDLQQRFPKLNILLTLGSEGSLCASQGRRFHQPIFPVKAVDTTAAGDTYSGFFIAALADGKSIECAMERAAMASAIAVTRKGAAPSIPGIVETLAALEKELEY